MRITKVEDARKAILSCHDISLCTDDNEFIYRIETPRDQDSPHFVSQVLTGGDKLYLGTIFEMSNFRVTKKSPEYNLDSIKLFDVFWASLQFPGDLGDNIIMEVIEGSQSNNGGGEVSKQRQTKNQAVTDTNNDIAERAKSYKKLQDQIDQLKKDVRELRRLIVGKTNDLQEENTVPF